MYDDGFCKPTDYLAKSFFLLLPIIIIIITSIVICVLTLSSIAITINIFSTVENNYIVCQKICLLIQYISHKSATEKSLLEAKLGV